MSTECMSTLTDNNNRKNFAKILPNFFYSANSEKRIRTVINRASSEHFEPLYNLPLSWQHDDRVFVEIPTIPDEDEAWRTFKSVIGNNDQFNRFTENTYIGFTFRSDAVNIAVNNRNTGAEIASAWLTIDDFRNNKFNGLKEANLPAGKLFKILLKHNYITQKDVDTINAIKNSNKDKSYLCISRNPIDFLFAATNQPFTSCLNLSSDYEMAYYMSLPALVTDQARYIAFICNGKLSRHTIKGYEFKHFRYHQRNWCILDESGRLFVDRAYPINKYDMRALIKKHLNMETCPEVTGTVRSKFCVFEANYQNAMIYLDTLKITSDDYKYYSYHTHYGESGDGASNAPAFDYDGTFEELDGPEQLTGKSKYTWCYNCDCRISNENNTYEYNDHIYCEHCYDRLERCADCGEIIENEDSYRTCGNHGNLCSSCADISPGCDYCGSRVLGHLQYTMHDGSIIGRECMRGYASECESCGELHYDRDMTEIDERLYCGACAEEMKEEAETETAN